MLPHRSRSFSLSVIRLGLVIALAGLNAPLSHAIPVAGNYQFKSGLTGTFTSDGSALTAWAFTIPSTNLAWTDLSPSMNETRNDSLGFHTESQIGFVTIDWSTSSFTGQIGNPDFGGKNFNGVIEYQQPTGVAVPEPGSAALLGVGLLVMLGRRRRRASGTGLQIG